MVAFRIRPAILLFGDSITQQGFGWEGAVGWTSLLSAAYSRRADVLNRGFSGYNTNHAVEILPRVFGPPTENRQSVLFATVFFGANDACVEGYSQHVPLDQYEANLRTIVTHMRNNPADVEDDQKTCVDKNDDGKQKLPIILITPPPLDSDAWEEEMNTIYNSDEGRVAPTGVDDKAWKKEFDSRARTNENSREYGKVVKKVAKEMDCLLLDSFELLGGNNPTSEYAKNLRDGLHFSSIGNTLLYEGLMELVQTELPHLAPMLDGNGRYGKEGIPLEEKLWSEYI